MFGSSCCVRQFIRLFGSDVCCDAYVAMRYYIVRPASCQNSLCSTSGLGFFAACWLVPPKQVLSWALGNSWRCQMMFGRIKCHSNHFLVAIGFFGMTLPPRPYLLSALMWKGCAVVHCLQLHMRLKLLQDIGAYSRTMHAFPMSHSKYVVLDSRSVMLDRVA